MPLLFQMLQLGCNSTSAFAREMCSMSSPATLLRPLRACTEPRLPFDIACSAGPSHAAATPQQPTSPAPSPAQNAHPPQHSSAAGPPQHVAANTGAPPPVSQPSPEAIAARSRHVGLPTQGEAHSLRQEGMRKPSPRRQMSAGSRQQQGQPAASQGRFSGFD